VKHEIPHDLDMDTAKVVARKAVESYAERFSGYGFTHAWVSETRVDLNFNVKGKRLEGSFNVHAAKLVFDLDVPFVFRVFTGQATKIIDRETRAWIDKAKSGQLDGG
jgi:hypothetical protein